MKHLVCNKGWNVRPGQAPHGSFKNGQSGINPAHCLNGHTCCAHRHAPRAARLEQLRVRPASHLRGQVRSLYFTLYSSYTFAGRQDVEIGRKAATLGQTGELGSMCWIAMCLSKLAHSWYVCVLSGNEVVAVGSEGIESR